MYLSFGARVCVALSLVSWACAELPDPVDLDIFKAGDRGYYCWRLPNLLELSEPGHLVAFAQGRKGQGCPDSGWMDSFVRRSEDNGKTWSPPALVYENPAHQTMGTPTAIADESTGVIFLFLNPQHGGRDADGGRRVLLLNSTDGGRSWSAPRDMTGALVPSGWDNVWMGTQQGITVDLSGGKKRLIMCANHHGNDSNGAHTVYSDDHGSTWQNGETLDLNARGDFGFGIGECALVQTSAGVFMYGRVVYDNKNVTASRRVLALSTDFGHSFENGNTSAFPGNPGADCEGAFVGHGDVFLVGSPYGQVGPQNPGRHNYSVLMSRAVKGRPSMWTKLAGADPLDAGVEAEYSTMLVSRFDEYKSFFVMYERGDLYGEEPDQPPSSLRLTKIPFPLS